jgi:hypothetical protein
MTAAEFGFQEIRITVAELGILEIRITAAEFGSKEIRMTAAEFCPSVNRITAAEFGSKEIRMTAAESANIKASIFFEFCTAKNNISIKHGKIKPGFNFEFPALENLPHIRKLKADTVENGFFRFFSLYYNLCRIFFQMLFKGLLKFCPFLFDLPGMKDAVVLVAVPSLPLTLVIHRSIFIEDRIMALARPGFWFLLPEFLFGHNRIPNGYILNK